MIDVEIKNFQAIDSLTLRVEGFTALVGRTNIGKSSIVRALKCALSGGSGSDFVRHDARSCSRILNKAKSCKCFASVKLMFEEGQGFLWEKGAKAMNRYTVWKDGVEAVYDRVGQSMELPDFLATHFAPVLLGPNNSLLQVASQFDAPFLLDLSGGAVADILSDIGKLDDINHAMAAVAKDRRSSVAIRKVREEDVKELSQRLAGYTSLDPHLQRVRDLEGSAKLARETASRRDRAERFIEEATEATRVMRRLTTSLEPSLRGSAPLLGASKRLGLVDGFVNGWGAREGAVARLERGLGPHPPELGAIASRAAQRSKLLQLERGLIERERVVEGLAKTELVEVPLEPGLRRRAADVALLSRWLDSLAKIKVVFAKATSCQGLSLEDPKPVASLAARLSKADGLAVRLDRLDVEIERLVVLEAESQKDRRAVLAEFSTLGICPACHQDISPVHVVACLD